MYCKLILVAIFCVLVRDAYGLECNNCTDATSCLTPNTAICNITAAYKNYQTFFAPGYNSPSVNATFACATANITFNGVLSAIQFLGCAFDKLNQSDSKTGVNTSSFYYESCTTDRCNAFPAVQPPNTISCYTCDSEPCGNDNKVQCTNSLVDHTFSSLNATGYSIFSDDSVSHNFKCLTLNTTLSNNGANETDIVYKGCIYSDVDICGQSQNYLKPGYKTNTKNCTECEGDYCNRTNGSSVVATSFLLGVIFTIVFGMKLI
ncbi:hypothetical protein ACFFRR_004316 [Megaselia abdita]